MGGRRMQDSGGVLRYSQPTPPIGHAVDRAGHRRPRMPRRVGELPVAHRDLPACRIERRARPTGSCGRSRRRGTSTRISSTERYGLGIGVAVFGQRAIERSGYQLARPVLAALSERTGESASLGVRRGTEVVVLDRVVGPAPLRFDHPAGAELAVHASAMGKVLLAFSSTSIADEVRTLDVLQSFTPRTIVDREALAAELADVVARGYATNNEERYDGVSGIAAPVRSPGGFAHAAVGLQGPSLRLGPAVLTELAPLVQAAANEVAALLIPR